MSKLHLTVVGSNPVSEGRFGCDYVWNDDFTAYWCAPHRWHPSEAGYIAYQCEFEDAERDDEDGAPVVESVPVVVFTAEEDDGIPF